MEYETMLWQSESTSMASAMVGRVMNTLLSARPKKLENAIVRLGEAPQKSLEVSLEESLRFLNKYVREAVDEQHSLDEVLVPMIENALEFKESKYPNQPMILLNWLFQDKALFTPIAKGLADIISRREDRHIAFGWCRLVRSLVDYENRMAQFLKNGLRDNYQPFLKILFSSVRHLLVIIRNGSVLQDGFELPTRLAVSAADCVLVLTEALTKKPMDSRSPSEKGPLRLNPSNKPVSILEEKQGEQKDVSPVVSNNIEGALLMWQLLDQLIVLVQKLHSWSQKSRPLHAKGLGRVLKWLHEINNNYVCAQDEAGSQFQTTGALLLTSCWRHYSMLSRLEDPEFSQRCDELVEQYLSGIQFYTEDNAKDHMDNRDSCLETRKFFLNCLALLLGRLDHKRLESTMSVYGLRMSQVLMSQLHCADEDVTDMAVCILKSVIFKISGSSLDSPKEMETLLPSLMGLLDERDGAARAVIVLIAEYCSISTDYSCLKEILKRLASGNVPQRRNAADVMSELIRTSANSTKVASGPFWQDIANQLLECLGDDESAIRIQATSLLPSIDPSLVLPTLVRYICLTDDPKASAASNAFVAVLRSHGQSFEVIRMLLDSLSNLCQTSVHLPGSEGINKDHSKFDLGEVFKLIPEWSKNVQDWNLLVEPLIDKMFSEPSNATIIRFLSCISEHLADTADIVLGRLLVRTHEQETTGGESQALKSDNSDSMGNVLFGRLCPLLIIKIFPLRVFNDLNCASMYSRTLRECIVDGVDNFHTSNYECVATLLFNRAFCQFEYEDVRKLAAELCGRIHPQVLFPVILSQLQRAAELKDILNIKASLFTICTSLAIRGWDSVSHPYVSRVIGILQAILLWPSVDGDEVSKAQHGCIDCLALMICAELQSPKPVRDSVTDKSPINVQNALVLQSSRAPTLGSSVLAFVIDNLANHKRESSVSSGLPEGTGSKTCIPISFRLCMANVLISTCQKISEGGKKTFAKKTLPQIIHLTEVIGNAAVRAACVQVLFSAVYSLKSLIVPYAHDFLKMALKFLGKETEQERMAGAKLMASLMASEDIVAESIARELPEVRSTLLNVSTSDPSPQLRQICQKLLACLTL